MSEESGGLSWLHKVSSIPAHGLDVVRKATAAECASLAEALEIVACRGVGARYTLVPAGKRRYRLEGEVEADVTQSCVVTLEPVEIRVEDKFRIEYCPPSQLESASGTEHEILTETDVESLEGDVIDVGRIVFELLLAGLDPYPRKEGTAFSWSDPVADASRAVGGAFAALRKLKDQD